MTLANEGTSGRPSTNEDVAKPIHTYSFIIKSLDCKLIFWWVGLRLISLVWDWEAGHSVFLCNLLSASLFIHALWVSTSGILQTSLDIHPKPKISFCDYLLYHNPIWVWIIISTESKESKAPYKEKFWETRLPGDSSGSTKKKVNLRYLP